MIQQEVPEDGPSSSEQSFESFGYQTSPEIARKSEQLSLDTTSFLKIRLGQIFRKVRPVWFVYFRLPGAYRILP